MKILKLLIIFGILAPLNSYSQNDTIIKSGFVNLAILIVDYDTYEFEGGNLSYYSCIDCNNDSLPFLIDYKPPGDFGDITFKLIPTLDTIFTGTIIWMGIGQINYPVNYSLDYPFNSTSDISLKPNDITYFDKNGQISNDTNFIQKADSVWNIIDTLTITNYYSEHNFKVGIYLYPPVVGAFNPIVAKWIVFLYYYDMTNSLGKYYNNKGFILFPNPTKNTIILDCKKDQSKILRYSITNLIGIILKEGIIENGVKINLSSFSKGTYYLANI